MERGDPELQQLRPSRGGRDVLRTLALIGLLAALAGSVWLSGATVRTYLRSMQAFRAMRLEIPAGPQVVVTRVDLTVAVVNGSSATLAVDELDVGIYLRGRFVARETVISTREVIPPGSTRAYPVSVTLAPAQLELLGDGGHDLRWSAQGLALVRAEGMRRSIPIRVATR